MPFGYGEVEPADGRNSTAVAQLIFIGRIQEDVPQVLADLADMPLQIFKTANVNPAELWPITEPKMRLYSVAYGVSLTGLNLALRWWARRWHLEADWCLDMACWTLDAWRRHGYDPKAHVWGVGGSHWGRLNDEYFAHLTPPLGLQKWDADYEFRGTYTKRAKERIEEELATNPMLSGLKPKMRADFIEDRMNKVNEYCEQVLSVYDAQVDALGRPRWKRAGEKKELLRNINWAVKFQVQGKTFSEIARTEETSPSTVMREVNSTLKLIRLPKRPDAKRGRPVGSKESPDSWRRATRRADILN